MPTVIARSGESYRSFQSIVPLEIDFKLDQCVAQGFLFDYTRPYGPIPLVVARPNFNLRA